MQRSIRIDLITTYREKKDREKIDLHPVQSIFYRSSPCIYRYSDRSILIEKIDTYRDKIDKRSINFEAIDLFIDLIAIGIDSIDKKIDL